MIYKAFLAVMLAAHLLSALSACDKAQSSDTSDKLGSAAQQTEQQYDAETSINENFSTDVEEVAEDEAWKEELEKSLFENYGVIPKYYEDLGEGIYQVYVEVGGEVTPLVTVDSATGEYQMNW